MRLPVKPHRTGLPDLELSLRAPELFLPAPELSPPALAMEPGVRQHRAYH